MKAQRFVLCVSLRSGENQVTMHKCFLLLIFMVLILPSLGLTRYQRLAAYTHTESVLFFKWDPCVLSCVVSLCSLDLFFTWLFDVNFLDERDVKFQ